MNIDYILRGTNILCYIMLILMWKSFLPSYFNKKGSNLADKEDISELTQVVEEVKNTYIHNQEEIKAKLDMIKTQSNDINREARSVLLRFHNIALDIFADKFQVNFWHNAGTFEENVYIIIAYQKDLDKQFINLKTDFHNIGLYYSYDSDIYKMAKQTLFKGLELRDIHRKYFKDLKMKFLQEVRVSCSGDEELMNIEYKNAVNESNIAKQEYDKFVQPKLLVFGDSFALFQQSIKNEFLKYKL